MTSNEHGYGLVYLEDVLCFENYKKYIRDDLTLNDFKQCLNGLYEGKELSFLSNYMFKVYCILIRRKI